MAALTEPMFQPDTKDVNSRTSRTVKLVALSFLIGLSGTMLLKGMVAQPAVQDPADSLAVMPATRAFMQPTRVVQPNGYALAKMYGIGASPVEQLALQSIELVNRRNRDVSMRADDELRNTADLGDRLSNFLESTIEDVNISEMVVLKAREMAGVTPPTDFFDPLGFSTDISPGKLLFYREVELKHGRVGMLAALGIIVGENFHPMFGGQIDVPSYIAFQETPLQKFWFLVITAIAIPEMFSVFSFEQVPGANPRAPNSGAWWEIRRDHEPGNFGFDPLNLRPTDAKEYREMQNKELNNGRLAMIAAAGMIAQELATGQKIFAR